MNICKLCLGCNKLETEFKEVNNCKSFVPAYDNWQERYYKELRGLE